MKIVVLNESFFEEKHLKRLKELGDVTIYNDTDTEQKAIERLQGAEIAIADCYICPLAKPVFEASKSLRFISINSTGYDCVDISSASLGGVRVANVPGFSTEAVAEHTIGLMLAVARKIPLTNSDVRRTPFQVDPANQDQRERYLGTNLHGKTLGVVGLGNIGQRVADLAQGFGMKVIAYNRSPKSVQNVETVALDQLLKDSDFISIHLPLTPETEGILSKEKLALMKPSAILINTSRGKCIDESALYECLVSGKIASAALDVVTDWSTNNKLFTLENVVATPHSAWFTKESLTNAADIILENVESYIQGKPINLVNE